MSNTFGQLSKQQQSVVAEAVSLDKDMEVLQPDGSWKLKVKGYFDKNETYRIKR